MKLSLLFPSLFLAYAAQTGAQECNPQESAQTVLEQEAKFYQMGQEQGTRAAFLGFLADDSIIFSPGPVNAKQNWTSRPEDGVSLKWKPLFVSVARSCDLAFTTGPAEWRKKKEDEKPFGFGQFVSIWKRQKDGAWKVLVDMGSEVPSARKMDDAAEIAVNPAAAVTGEPAVAAKKLRQAEMWFAETAKTDSTAALIGSSSETVRVLREGVFPAAGREAASLMLSVRRGTMSVERLGGEMSRSADLAFSYGKYSLVRPENTERGHYLQIWQTDNAGAWKLALDYQTPLPPEPKR